MRLVIPVVHGRGAGLGNELIPWARAKVIAAALGAHALRPAFGLNARHYYKDFKSNRLDWIAHRLYSRFVPTFDFTEAEYREVMPLNLVKAAQEFGWRKGLDRRTTWAVRTSGLWGGYSHIRPAVESIKADLYGCADVLSNILQTETQLTPGIPKVGVHIRRGDFVRMEGEYKGRFNVRIPDEWYISLLRGLHKAFDGRVQFLLVSDSSTDWVRERFPDLLLHDTFGARKDVSDLLLMSRCDLIVCSVSSYSAWAAAFSEAPYVWFKPNLTDHSGYLGIWAHEGRANQCGSDEWESLRQILAGADMGLQRAYAVGWDGVIPAALVAAVQARGAMRVTDIVNYGWLKDA